MAFTFCLPFLHSGLKAQSEVEVLYFHGKQRCATCMAIEKNARNAVNTQLASELKNGKVVSKLSNPYESRIKVAESLIGVIPDDISYDEVMEERLSKL